MGYSTDSVIACVFLVIVCNITFHEAGSVMVTFLRASMNSVNLRVASIVVLLLLLPAMMARPFVELTLMVLLIMEPADVVLHLENIDGVQSSWT